MDEPDWLRTGGEAELRAAIKFDRGEPRPEPGCIDDPVKWQRGHVFHPVLREWSSPRSNPMQDVRDFIRTLERKAGYDPRPGD